MFSLQKSIMFSSPIYIMLLILAMTTNALGQEYLEAQISADLMRKITVRFVRIEAGSFHLGAIPGDEDAREIEKPRREVNINHPFYIQTQEVSNELFEAFVTSENYRTEIEFDCSGKRLKNVKTWRDVMNQSSKEHPVVLVTIGDAIKFAEWFSGKTGYKVRLPTEEEWEYCCRAGTDTIFATGNSASSLKDAAWVGQREIVDSRKVYNDDEIGTNKSGPRPVSSGSTNLWQLQNMHGNVSELVDSWYTEYGTSLKPSQTIDKKLVVRGGNWQSGPEFARSSARSWVSLDVGDERIGFRLVFEKDDK